MNKLFVSILVIILLVIAACGQETPPPASDTGVVSSGPATDSADSNAPTTGSEATDTAPSTSSSDSSAATTAPQTWQVKIKDFKFTPQDLTIKAGDTVTWTNEDGVAHTATADDRSFDSDRLTQGASYSFTFTTAGAFEYFCDIHPSMRASVKVE